MGMIQIRNVPPELHLKLKARAAKAGMSLSDYLLRDAQRLADQLTPQEMKARLDALPRITLKQSPAEILREERDSR